VVLQAPQQSAHFGCSGLREKVMKQTTLIKLGALAAALLAAAWFMRQQGQPAETALSGEAPVVAGLAEQINAVSALKLTGAGNVPIISLKKTDKGWVAEDVNQYEADINKIREYLIKLSEAKVREAKTSNVKSYDKLGVEDLVAANAKGIQLELMGLSKPVKIIFGAPSGTGGMGVYFRNVGEAQSYLASGAIRPEAAQNLWLQADLTSIAASRIKSVEILPPSGDALIASKASSEDADWAVQNVPKGKTLSSPSVGNQLAGTLDNLRFESVVPAANAEPAIESTYRAKYLSFEGVLIEITAWEKDSKAYARFNARLDTAQSEMHLLAEQAKAEAKAKAEVAAPADGKVAPAPTAFNAAKFRTEKLAELSKEIEGINKRTAGWTYVLPTYKFATIKKSMTDMLADPNAVGTAQNPLNFPIQ
jgi:Domain of unknown function (DUF4340)